MKRAGTGDKRRKERKMSDLISRQAAISTLDDEITITGKSNAYVVKDYVQRVKRKLENLPSAEPKTGKWTVAPICITCSECGESFPLIPQNYCPNCGARMTYETD